MASTYPVFIYTGLSFGWLTWFVWRRKGQIDHMHAMISGMSMGMFIGLIAGLLFGAQLKGDLYSSTVWGMLAGGAAGFIFGIPVSLLCTIEGTLSGVMAGMMGAMLGEMVPPNKVGPLLFLFLLLFTGCILLVTKMVAKEEEGNGKMRPFSIHNPILPALVLTGVFFWYQTLEISLLIPGKESQHGSHLQSGHTVQDGNDQPAEQVLELTIEAVDFSYRPNELFIKKGVPTKLHLKNYGSVEHDLEIIAEKNSFLFTPSANSHAHHGSDESAKVHLHAKPGEVATSVIHAKAEGTYRFICTIPGHKENGMIGTIKVM